MRRLIWCCAAASLALVGCDDGTKGAGTVLVDVGSGAGDATIDTTGGEGDTGGPGDVSGPGDTALADTGATDTGAPPEDTSTPDDALADTATPTDTLDDAGGPGDTAVQDDTVGDAGNPTDTGTGDTGNPEDTAKPTDTAPEDTGPPPTDPSGLRITEIMYDPAAVNDEGGEWIELLNTGAETVNLVGLTIADSATPHVIVAPAPIMVPAGGYAVLGTSADAAKSGGITPTYVYADFGLTNTKDSVVLLTGTTEIDRVDYDEAAGWPDAMGFSIQLDPTLDPKGEHNAAADWCAGSTPFGAGDLGSPGMANPTCVEPPDPGDPSGLVITEIMYDPTAVSDADGEWVELLNTGAKDVDLRGLSFADSGTSTVIDDAAPLWVPAGGRALIGRNKDMAQNGGLTLLWSYGFGLNNDKDSVILSKGAVEIDRVDYDEGAGWPVAVGASIQLDGDKDPTAVDNALPASWCVSTATATSGDLGTPAAANTSCATAPVGPCVGNCDAGNAAEQCWCDANCVTNGDCCSDACDTCGYCGTAVGDCVGKCGGAGTDTCWCDSACVLNGDCCDDACETCGVCDAPPADTCVGACGGAGGTSCWCDELCVTNGDCCPDSCAACGFCP